MASMDVSLADIMGGNQLILTDSVVKRFSRESWYREHVKPAQQFDEMDNSLLEAVSAHLQEVLQVYDNKNTLTIPAAVDEMKTFAKILAKKYQRLAKSDRRDSPSRRALCSIYMNQVLLYNQAQTRILTPQEPRLLEDLGQRVLLISRMSDPRRKQANKTDELLVAAGIYLVLERSKEVTVLTVDRDLCNILDTCMQYFKGMTYQGQLVGDILEKTPLMVCYSNTDNPLFAIERESSPPPPVDMAMTSVKRSIDYVMIKRRR